MKELLQSRGFYMFNSCNCGGSYNENWRNDSIPGVEIKIIPSYDTFQIKRDGVVYDRGSSASFVKSMDKI